MRFRCPDCGTNMRSYGTCSTCIQNDLLKEQNRLLKGPVSMPSWFVVVQMIFILGEAGIAFFIVGKIFQWF